MLEFNCIDGLLPLVPGRAVNAVPPFFRPGPYNTADPVVLGT